MADLSKVTLPDSTTVNIKDSTARQAIDDAVTMTFATVATSGSYNDLSNRPTIPTITLNGSSTTSPSFYAPTSAGTSGQVLTSNGSGAPTWGSAPASGPWESGTGAYSAQLADADASAGGDYSVAEGAATTSGDFSHAEGGGLSEEDAYDIYGEQEAIPAPAASGFASHAEGMGTSASSWMAHAEGFESTASNEAAHAEGCRTTASGGYSHAEGNGTLASGPYAHAEGEITSASGHATHAEGVATLAQNSGEHASGKYNSSTKTNTTWGNAGNTHFSIGIGTQNAARSNALEIMQNGDMYVKGVGSYTGAYASSGIKSLQTVIGEKVSDVTIGGTSIVSNGTAAIPTSAVSGISIDSAPTANSNNLVTSGGVKTALDAKQATLVSGTNIKTINNESILGDGNLTITGGSGGVTDVKLSDGSSIVTSGIANLPFPPITYADDGKILVADSGHWSAVDNPPEVYTFYAEYAMAGNWNLYHTTGLYDAIVNKIPVVLIVTTPGGNNAQLSLIYDSYSFYDEDADTYKDGIFFASSPLYDSNNGQIEIVYAILEPGEESESESESESDGWTSISVYEIDSWFITSGGSGGVTDVTVGGSSVVNYNGVAVIPSIPTVPTISTNISTDANSDVKTASPKAVKTYVDNSISAIPDELPSVSSSDNGKVLMVVSGAWAAATLNTQTYYTGQSTPSSSLGNNGDLYLQIDE